MSIKVTIDGELPVPVKTFPKLMVDSNDGEIVLFSEPEVGTVIGQAVNSRSIGHWKNDWLMETFVDYTGKVILSNK